MAVYTVPYPGVNKSLPHLKKQILHSILWTAKNTPPLKTPEEIFNYAKKHFTYKNDPPGVELFQTVPTLLSNNVTPPGHGDCDDATIYILTLMFINGLNGGFVLAGRHTISPTHIYAYCDYNGKRYILDLTQKYFNSERYYPYKQYIPLTIPKNQLNMLLQLADNGSRRRKRGRSLFSAFMQKSPAYSAKNVEKAKAFKRRMRKASTIFLPSKNVNIPAHHFDKLPWQQVQSTLLSEGYDEAQLSELAGWRQRREERRAERQKRRRERYELRMEKKRARIENIRARAEKKRATAELRRQRGLAKVLKAKARQTQAERGEGGAGGFFRGMKGMFKKSDEGEEAQPEEETQPEEVEAEEVQAEEVPQEETPQETENLEEGDKINILGLSIDKGTALIGGSVLLVGSLYLINRNKKR